MSPMSVEEFEAGIAGVSSSPELWKLVTEFIDGSEVERVIYHHLPPIGAPDGGTIDIAAHGVPDDMLHRYIDDRLYRENPLLLHALGSVEPFYFDEIGTHAELTRGQRAFLDAVDEVDFLRGLGVQVFGPNGRNGYCGLGFQSGVTRLDPARVRSLQWVCQLGHLRYCSLLLPAMGPAPQLSGREAQVLGWVARGKSNAVIGEILGISGHTVDAHLRRVYLKLGVFDRVSAALRGVGYGLIHASS